MAKRIVSDELRSAVRAYAAARFALIERLQAECPGETLVANKTAYVVTTGRGGSPRLNVSRIVRVRRPGPGPAAP
jgi:hypothetical protein